MKSVIAFAAIVLVFGCAEAFRQLARKRCPEICPMIYAPVCGTDGIERRVFSNRCIMNVYACKESKEFIQTSFQECNELGPIGGFSESRMAMAMEPKVNPVNCPPCTRIYAPVCGTDGVEIRKFSNACMMDYENCMQRRDFHILKGVRDC